MDEYVLIVIFAIAVMLFFATFVIRNVIKRINDNTKRYFIDKLQDYDYLIDEKKEILGELSKRINILTENEEIKKEIEEFRKNKVQIEKQIEEAKKQQEDVKEDEEIIYDVPMPQYRQEEFFHTYKQLKKQFNLNSKEILSQFIEEHKDDKESAEYKKLGEIRKDFSQETVYQILTFTPEEQFDLVKKALNKTEQKIVELQKYKPEKISVLVFLENIDIKLKELDPTIYVYVANEEINYDYMNEKVKTLTYKNMSEGIIIEYHNKMYDYSI